MLHWPEARDFGEAARKATRRFHKDNPTLDYGSATVKMVRLPREQARKR